MKLHRPSAAAGVGVGLAAVLLVVFSVVSASALTWPWSPPPDKSAAVETVTGSVSCSNVTDIGTGYGGNPASLTVDVGSGPAAVSWPFQLRSSAFGNIFRPPTFTGYRWLVTIPAGKQQVTAHWSLTCRDQTGVVNPTPYQGAFTVGRKNLSRTICSSPGEGVDPCTSPKLQEDLSGCAYALLSPYTGSPEIMTALDIANNHKGSQWLEFFAGKADPVLGLAIACAKAAGGVVNQPPPSNVRTVTVPPPGSTAPASAPHTTAAPPPAQHSPTQHPASSASAAPPVKPNPVTTPSRTAAPPPPTTSAAPPPPVTSAAPPPPASSNPPPPPPGPSTFSEITGGPTHTWTNYTNAGGTAGAVIPTNATVQIACKLTGFRVPDGNTWWYRIASSPWNGAFYASADAFYNNGATSGSLNGTPYVDPAVPNC